MYSIYDVHLGQARDVLGGMWSMMYAVHVYRACTHNNFSTYR